jgi:parallel beta-helix repeat protein
VVADKATGSVFEKLRLVNNGSNPNGASGPASLSVGAGCSVKDCEAYGSKGYAAAITTGDNCTVSGCTVANSINGIFLGSNCTIVNSTASGNTDYGLQTGRKCSVLNCTISGNVGTSSSGAGIGAASDCLIAHCTIAGNGSYGIYLSDAGCMVVDCTVADNQIGVYISSGGTGNNGHTVRGCTLRHNSGTGVHVGTDNALVIGNIFETNNTAGTSGVAGLEVAGKGCRIEGNSFMGNNFAGMTIDGSGNLVIRNSFSGAQYITQPGNTFGPFIDMSASGGTISNTNPWANIGY